MTAPGDIFLFGAILLAILIPQSILLLIFEFFRLRALIREQRPQEWTTHGGAVSTTCWIACVVFGRAKLDIPGKRYSRRLSYVRWSLCLIPLYLAALLGLFAWRVF